MKYRADIDGLRAVAVLSVLFYHANFGFPGGYVGVDVFFVISGYLITGLIVQELRSGRFELGNFWERRVRRILPPLALMVVASFGAAYWQFFPLDFKEFGQSATAQALLVSNFYFWRTSGYFAQAAEVKPLLHTWSLAVEEQFYVLFPVLLIVLRRCSPRFLIGILLLLSSLSFGLNLYGTYRYPLAAFYLLPPRAWELMLGSILAVGAGATTGVPARWLRELLGWLGMLVIAVAIFGFDRATRFPGFAALVPCVGAGLIIWANAHQLTGAGRVLSARPMVFVGLISYSLYLWHWPVLVLARYLNLGPVPPGQRLLCLGASLVLAIGSWRFVETPVRRRLLLGSRRQIFAFALFTTGLLSLGGWMINRTQGLPGRLPEAARRYAAGLTDRTLVRDSGMAEAIAGNFLPLGNPEPRRPIKVMVWGDSHARSIMPVLDRLCRDHSVRGVAATHSSTAPFVGYVSTGPTSLQAESPAYNQAVVDFIRRERVEHVILAAKWGSYISPTEIPRLRRGLADTVAALQNTDVRIWVMKQVPEHPWSVPRALTFAVLRGQDPDELGRPLPEHLAASQLRDQIFDRFSAPRLTLLDPTPWFVDASSRCRVALNGRSLYYDDHHLSTAGAMLLRPLFEPIFGSADRPDESPVARPGR